MLQKVGISELKVAKGNGDELITYSLGSCVGLSIYDKKTKVGGLIHCMLPSSSLDKEKAKANPCMFIDTGVFALLKRAIALGAERKKLIAKVAGGAAPPPPLRALQCGSCFEAVCFGLLCHLEDERPKRVQ